LRSGAPPSLVRIAAIGALHPTTVREHSSREKWPSPKFHKAEACWAAGDVAGAIAETALALARANGVDMARLRTLMLDGAGGAVGEEPFPTALELEAALAAPPQAADGGSLEDNRTRLANILSRQTGLMLRAVEASGGILSKRQIDAVASLVRLAESFETPASARMAELQNKSDDERADIHRRIDERVVELAYAYAKRMVAGEALD
jgi:hypothetical protein